jgi:hypothetical protein
MGQGHFRSQGDDFKQLFLVEDNSTGTTFVDTRCTQYTHNIRCTHTKRTSDGTFVETHPINFSAKLY